MASIAMGLVLFLHVPANAAATGATVATGAAQAGTGPSVDVVILGDESGSMLDNANEFVGMEQAATQIVDLEWSPQSRIAIYGFGSAPPGKPASTAIDQYCPLTALDSPGARGTLIRCAAEIQARTAGNNTDFAQALQQAYEALARSRAAGHLPLVFFMSDGALDEGPNSSYAHGASDPNGAIGNSAAQALITAPSTGWLARLRGIGAEVWPIRFGSAPKGENAPDGQAELALFAAGGAQNGCPAGDGANPRVTPIPPADTGEQERQDFQTALIAAFAEARCAVVEQPGCSTLSAGSTVPRTVTISELATNASITVDKGSPQAVATFRDPRGDTFTDTSPGGQGASVVGGVLIGAQQYGQHDQLALETLQLQDPAPGPWQVTFRDPAGVAPQRVCLSVVWQGELGLQFTDQQVGDPGHSYTLAVQPVVRSARVPASELGGFTGQFQVTWPGGQAVTVPARLDTATTSPTSGDFTASVLVPQGLNGQAHVIFTGAASGVQGATDTAFPVRPGGGLIITLDNTSGDLVQPGHDLTINGTVNTNGQPGTSILFALAGLKDGVDASLTSPFGQFRVPSGQLPITLTIHFDKKARPGRATGTIQWAPADQGTPAASDYLSAASLDVVIGYPPPPVTSQWWLWLIIALAAAGMLAFLGWRLVIWAAQRGLPPLPETAPDIYRRPPGPPSDRDPWKI
jgi:hypothetical protein